MKKTLIALATAALFTGSALAADLATPDEAKAAAESVRPFAGLSVSIGATRSPSCAHSS